MIQVDPPIPPEVQKAANTIKDLLMTSDLLIRFPFWPDCEMKLTITGKLTRKQWATMIEVIQLAEDSCCVDDAPEPSNQPERPNDERVE